MKVVITGFMGCGKTVVARALARRLNLGMIDLDNFITEREGRSPAQLIVEDGEEAFRAIETHHLRELLKTDAAGVIALGGGTWIQETNRELIHQNHCLSVWLDAPFEICWNRIEASEEHRPLGKTREQAQALFAHRRPIYGVADVHISIVASDSVDDIADRITL